MTTTTTTGQGKAAWEWMQQRCPKWGTMLVPEARFPYGPQPDAEPLTVGELEQACGVGALTAAKRYCQRYQRRRKSHPYAARIIKVYEGCMQDGWSAERAEAYVRDYWVPRYGTDTCLMTVSDGEERPDDVVRMS